MDLKEIGVNTRKLNDSAEYKDYWRALVNALNLRVPYTRLEEGRSALKMLTAKPSGKRPLGRPRCRWEDNIRMDRDIYQCGELG